MLWLLAESTARELRALYKTRSAAAVTEHRARFAAYAADVEAAARDGKLRNLHVAGETAEIRIEGVLTPKLDFWLWLFGIANTAYSDVQAAIAAAVADPEVKKVLLYVNSPGGTVEGLFETIEAIEGVSKPKAARSPLAASAAFGLASAAKQIDATGPSATFGSVGVVATYMVDDDLIEITSTEAPDKRPDPTTEEGKATIREYLDAVHQLFAEAIARGRGTTVAKVNTDFGRGAVMLAGDAKKRGMIDSIAKRGTSGDRTSKAAAMCDTSETSEGTPEMLARSLVRHSAGGASANERPKQAADRLSGLISRAAASTASTASQQEPATNMRERVVALMQRRRNGEDAA